MAIILCLLACLSAVQAHSGSRVYPITELSDEDVGQIDVRDGSVDDWLAVLGEPTLTSTDFNQFESLFPPIGPSELRIRVWLAWHAGTNRIYGAIERTDDEHVPESECAVDFLVDGDHSGGRFLDWTLEEEERLLFNNSQAQWYRIYGEPPDDQRPVDLHFESGYLQHWFVLPPYADAGGFHEGEAHAVSVTEFYVSPSDRLVWNSPEQSVVSALRAGQIIGFDFSVWDVETRDGEVEPIQQFYLHLEDVEVYGNAAGGLVDGYLVPSGDASTATHARSWARVKATFR